MQGLVPLTPVLFVSQLYTVGPPYPQVPHMQIQPTVDQKYFLKISKFQKSKT